MANTESFDPTGSVSSALRAAVAARGSAVLRHTSMLRSVLSDTAAEAPRESGIILLAADAGVADLLSQQVGHQGVDPDSAIRLTAGLVGQRTSLGPEACAWATTAFAQALGLLPDQPPGAGYALPDQPPGYGQPADGWPTSNPSEPRSGAGLNPGWVAPHSGETWAAQTPSAGWPAAGTSEAASTGWPAAGTPEATSGASPGAGAPEDAGGGWPPAGPSGGWPAAAPPGGWSAADPDTNAPTLGATPRSTSQGWPGAPAAGAASGVGAAAGPTVETGTAWGGGTGANWAGGPGAGSGANWGAPPAGGGDDGRRRSRPLLLIGAIALGVVIVAYFGAAAGAHLPPFSKSSVAASTTTSTPLSTTTTSPLGTSTTSVPPSTTTPTSVVPTTVGPQSRTVAQLAPADIKQATQCRSFTPPVPHLVGLTAALECVDSSLPGGTIFGLQFGSPANYAASVTAFNTWLGFSAATADDTCPPVAGTQGEGEWHDNGFPTLAGQTVECLTVGAAHTTPAFTWFYPSQDAIFDAQGAANSSLLTLSTWWTDHADAAGAA